MSTRAGRGGHGERPRGVALVLVLWVTLVVGLLSLSVLASARARADGASLGRAGIVGRYAAESGVVEARALLEEVVLSATTPDRQAAVVDLFRARVEGGPRPLGSARYQLVVEDLNGRIDLNRSPEPVVLGLLRQLVPEDVARGLLSALRPSGTRDFSALAGGPGATDSLLGEGVSVRPLTRIELLPRIPGFDPSLAAAIAPYVTVWGDGPINVNSASLPVLRAVPGLGEAGARAVARARESGRLLESTDAVQALLAETGSEATGLTSLTTAPRRVLVVSRGWEEGHPAALEIQAVFDVVTSRSVSGPRVRLRSWTERAR